MGGLPPFPRWGEGFEGTPRDNPLALWMYAPRYLDEKNDPYFKWGSVKSA